MKLIKPFLLACFLILTSYYYDPIVESEYTPVLMLRSELNKSITNIAPKPLSNSGKIYTKGNWVFISEKYEGIHVIDNSNPEMPVNTGFITVPGCLDMAMKGNYLYVDNSVDLVTIDMSNYPNIKVSSRIENVFPEMLPPDTWSMPSKYTPSNRPKNTVIIQWKPANEK